MVTSRPAHRRSVRRFTYADLPRNPMPNAQPDSWLRETISGIAGCFFGARARWSTPYASICQEPHRYSNRSRIRLEAESLQERFAACTRSAKTSAWIMLCSSPDHRKESRIPKSSVYRQILGGTIWALERTARASCGEEPAVRRQPHLRRRDLHPECDGKLHSCSR